MPPRSYRVKLTALDIKILTVLAESSDHQDYGYSILAKINRSGEQSSGLYRALRRLEQNKCVVAEWHHRDAAGLYFRQPRRYYIMTSHGYEKICAEQELIRKASTRYYATFNSSVTRTMGAN